MNYYSFAEKDLKSAKLLISVDGDCDVIMAHLQQSVEKFLNHLLEVKKGQQSKTHSLVTLMDLVDENNLSIYRPLFLELQVYYLSNRYPGEDYFPSTMEACLELSTQVDSFKKVIDSILGTSSSNEMGQVSFDDF